MRLKRPIAAALAALITAFSPGTSGWKAAAEPVASGGTPEEVPPAPAPGAGAAGSQAPSIEPIAQIPPLQAPLTGAPGVALPASNAGPSAAATALPDAAAVRPAAVKAPAAPISPARAPAGAASTPPSGKPPPGAADGRDPKNASRRTQGPAADDMGALLRAGSEIAQRPDDAAPVLRELFTAEGQRPATPERAGPTSSLAPPAFHNDKYGFRLDLYAALIQHVLDQPPAARETYRAQYLFAIDRGHEVWSASVLRLAEERTRGGFPFEPARLDTVLDRQTGSRYQAVVEMVNNGFDAMGDAVGRYGVGVFQAVGWLEEDGESLAYSGIPASGPRRLYKLVFRRAEGRLWIDMSSETAAPDSVAGTEVELRKNKPIDAAALRGYLSRKLELCRRGKILEGDKTLNELSAYRALDGGPVAYRLGGRAVRFELRGQGRELRLRDEGRGLGPATLAESLPVPGASTNASNAERALAGGQGAEEAQLFYKPGPPSPKGKAAFLAGGTEVETLALDGTELAEEIALDLPAASFQKESRAQVTLDPATVDALKALLRKTSAAFKREPLRLAPVVNSLAAAMAALQGSNRVKSLRKEDDVFLYLRERVGEAVAGLDEKRFAVVPSRSQGAGWLGQEALAGRLAVALDARLWDFDPATIGGEALDGEGKSVWAAGIKTVFERVGERLLLLSRAAVESQKAKALAGQAPVLLNLILGTWHGYGDRPEAEARLLAEPMTAAQESRLLSPPAETARAMLKAESGLSPRARYYLEPVLSRALEAGESEESLKAKLARIAQVYSAAPSLPLSALTSIASLNLEKINALVSGKDRLYILGEDRNNSLSVIEIGDGGARTIFQQKESDVTGQIMNVGGKTFFGITTYGTTQTETLYEIKDGTLEPVSGLTKVVQMQVVSMSAMDGRLFVSVRNHSYSWALYELKGGTARLIPGFDQNLVEILQKTSDGRLIALAEDRSSPYKSLYEINEGRARPIASLEHKKVTEETRKISDGRLFIIAEESNGSMTLYEIQNGMPTPVPGFEDAEAMTFTSGADMVFVYRKKWNDIPWRLYKIDKGAFQHVPGFKYMREAPRFVSSTENRAFIRVAEPEYHNTLYEIEGAAARIVQGLEHKSGGFDDPIGNDEATVTSLREPNGSWTLYEITNKEARPVPGFVGKETLHIKVIGGQILITTQEAGGRNVYQWENGKPRLILQCGLAKDIAYQEVKGRVFLRVFESDDSWTVYELKANKAKLVAERFLGRKPELAVLGQRVVVLGKETEDAWTVQDLDPLAQVSAAGLKLPPGPLELPSGLDDREKNRLARNLAGVEWGQERFQRLGWALPFADRRLLERLDARNAEALSRELRGLLEERQREAFSFLSGAGRALEDARAFNGLVFRWLLLFGADAKRALELARSFEGRYDELAKSDSAEDSPLLAFLRGQTGLEPLRRQDARDAAFEGEQLGKAAAGMPLSSLAGARANLGLTARTGRRPSVDELADAFPAQGYPQTEKAIERAQGAPVGYEWLREGVQNGVKASEEAGVPARVEVTAALRESAGKTALVVSMRDYGQGMDAYEMLHDLLPLDRSSFNQGQDSSLGYNGRGWYKFLVRSDRVRVVSGKRGAGRRVALEAYKERLPDGRFRWLVSGFRELDGEFEGTRVDWVQEKPGSPERNRLAFELEAALIGDGLETYVGALGERGAAVSYNGRGVMEQVRELGAADWADGEKVRVVETSSKKRRVLQGGFFVMDLEQDPDIWALVPEELRDFMRANGLSLELPSGKRAHAYSITLDRDRSGLAEKERYLPRLRQAVLAAVSQAAARATAEGTWKPRQLPADYVYRPEHLETPGLRAHGRRLWDALRSGWESAGRELILGALAEDRDGGVLAHFIASVEFPWNGAMVSLAKLREAALAEARGAGPVSMAGEPGLPAGYAAARAQALGRHRALAAATAADDLWRDEDESKLSEQERRQRKLLSQLVSGIMTPLARERLSRPDVRYRVSFGKSSFPRLAVYDRLSISFNTQGEKTKRWLAWIEKAAAGASAPAEDYRMLFEITESVIHEDAHAWEGTGVETHNAAFTERMRGALLELAALGLAPERVLDGLRAAPRP